MERLFKRCIDLVKWTEEMWEEEDSCLETWLTCGVPDGASPEEYLDFARENYEEFKELYETLKKRRKENED